MEFGLSGAIQLANRLLAGRRPPRELVADLVSDLSQIGSSYLQRRIGQIPFRYPGAHQAFNVVRFV